MIASKRVLIVDDDSQIVAGMRLRLEAAGYKTSTAGDGQECLESAVLDPPDAIVLDVRMPRLDGLSTLERLRMIDRTRHVPVVMLSASLADQRAALDAGARFFLSKPYQGSKLIEAVHCVIDDFETQA